MRALGESGGGWGLTEEQNILEDPEDTVPRRVTSRRGRPLPAYPPPSGGGDEDAGGDGRASPFPYAENFEEWVADETAASTGSEIERGEVAAARPRGMSQGGREMHARVATFESDPSKVDEAIAMIRSTVDGEVPPGLEGAKMLMLVDRSSGKGIGITLFEDEEAMRRGDRALDAMNPGSSERRVSVEFFEVPVQTLS